MREGNGTAGTEYLSGMSGRKQVPLHMPPYTGAPDLQQVPFPLLSVQIYLLLCQRLGYTFLMVIWGKGRKC